MKEDLTLEEMKEKIIQQFDEQYLLEILNLTTEELVERLTDDIQDKYDAILDALE